MTSRQYHSSRTRQHSQMSQSTKRIITRYNNNYNKNNNNTKEHSAPIHQSDNPSKYKSRHNKTSSHRHNTKFKYQKRTKYSKSAALRRKQRDINYQYKLYSLREIIQKITTKSSIISTNTAKDTIITYYQTFTTSQELLDELEHRFFSVLPIEMEDKQTRPYISDTDSVSERHFRFGSNNHSITPRKHVHTYHINHNNKEIAMDENKAYCIQVRVVNLLTFWMKEYFMQDFNELNMLQSLKNFIHKIKSLKQKQRLPSIPFDDEHNRRDIGVSDIPSIPCINDEDNNIYQELNRLGTNNGISPVHNQINPHNNNNNHTIIKSYHHAKINNNNNTYNYNYKRHTNFTINSNPLHTSNTNVNSSNVYAKAKAMPLISDGQTSQHTGSLKTEQMDMIATKIHPIHNNIDDIDIKEEKCKTEIYMDMKEEEKELEENIFMLNPRDNTVYIPSNELCIYNHVFDKQNININNINGKQMDADLFFIINGVDNIKVMIRNICDYNNMHNKHIFSPPQTKQKQKEKEKEKVKKKPTDTDEKCVLQLHENPKVFKRQKNITHSKESDEKEKEDKEVTENITPITSSTDPRDHSMTSLNKMEDSRISVEDPIFMDEDNNNNNNIIRRYYVSNPSKYKSLADKMEKTLFKQKKEAPKSSEYIVTSMSHRSLFKQKKHPVSSMAQLGSSLRGSAKIREMFLPEILPLKEDFQNKVKNQDIAEQITLMTFKAFKRVRKREFIDQAWKCKDRLELAGNLCQLIDHFNCISRWVQITILHCKDVKRRGRMIKKFIKIMDMLLRLNNFQSLCAVYGAITSSAIYSLENAWLQIPGKHKKRFEEIKHYFVTANNMLNLRNLHKERNTPMIPYTGIYLQDLIQTEERFKERMLREQMKNNNSLDKYDKYDFSGCGGVVFDHLTKMSKQIDNILIYAREPYHNINDDHIIQKYILSEFADQESFTEDEIYKLSENIARADAEK